MHSVSRRHVLATTAALVATAVAPRIVLAQAPPAGPFKRDPLPYAANALEPHIDAKTMEIHPERHHQAYVNNLNNAAKDHPQIAQKPIPEVLAKLGELPESIRTAVRNNLGGHANHTMFWQIMGPGGGQPQGEVAAAITRDLGGLPRCRTTSTPPADGCSAQAGCSSPSTHRQAGAGKQAEPGHAR